MFFFKGLSSNFIKQDQQFFGDKGWIQEDFDAWSDTWSYNECFVGKSRQVWTRTVSACISWEKSLADGPATYSARAFHQTCDMTQLLPSWESTYPHPRHVWVDNFPFPVWWDMFPRRVYDESGHTNEIGQVGITTTPNGISTSAFGISNYFPTNGASASTHATTADVRASWNCEIDGRNPIPNHLGCTFHPCKKSWDKLPTSTGERRISEPSTVWLTHLEWWIIAKGSITYKKGLRLALFDHSIVVSE